MYADRHAWKLRDVQVRPRLEQGSGPAVIREIFLDGDLDDGRRSRLMTVAGRCPVHRLLSAPLTTVQVEQPVVDADDAGAQRARRPRAQPALPAGTPGPQGKAWWQMPQQQIILVRHAETAWNRSRRYYTGQDDPGLTAAGEREAGLLLPHLKAYQDAHVLCSPALRARRTAALAGLNADISPDLREWSCQLPDGHTVDERCPSGPCHHDIWDTALRTQACTGECLPEVTARADGVLGCARRLSAGGRPVVLISHGNLIRLMTARWLGLPAAAAAHLALRTASIGRLAHYDGRPSLLGWNFSPSFDAPALPLSPASTGSGTGCAPPALLAEPEHPVALSGSDQ